MSSLTKKLLFVLIPALVLLIGLLALLIFLPGKSHGQIYLEQISTARKLAESGNYEQAIVHYRQAIHEDDTKEESYLELADIYFLMNLETDGIQVLKEGYEKTNSLTILSVIKMHENSEDPTDAESTDKKDPDNVSTTVNTTMTDIFSSYNFQKYGRELTVKEEKDLSGVYTITYVQYDAVFEYADSINNKVIDPKTHEPFDYARPTAIKLNKLSLLIPGVENGVSMAQLKELGFTNLSVGAYDDTHKCNMLTAEFGRLKVTLGCDESGSVKGDNAYNCFVPPVGVATIQKGIAKIKIIDATTGEKVSSAKVIVHQGKDNPNGTVVTEATVNGSDSLELDYGDYTVQVIADGYNEEAFNLYVSDVSDEIETVFTISPQLGSNEIRFVLEWGASPVDVDSHLMGTCEGTSIDVDWTKQTAKKGNDVIAELDVDDRDGFGPETITLYNTNGTFEYKVHRFSSDSSLGQSGATVKIYTSGSSSPIVVSPPDNVDDEWWTVCKIENGAVKDINGRQS